MALDAGVPFLGTIPIEPAVREGGDEGIPIVISNPSSPAGEAFNRLAEGIVTRFETGNLQGTADLEIEITE
jgi:ATP-binding protein involved in chromosome partitioning